MARSFCSLLSTHGRVLSYVARHPDATLRQMAEELNVTERTVMDVVGDLRRAEILSVRRQGRRNTYAVNHQACLPEPHLQGATVGDFVKLVANAS